MSMNGCFRTASNQTIKRLRVNQAQVPGFLGLDEIDEVRFMGGGAPPFLRLVRDEEDLAEDTEEGPDDPRGPGEPGESSDGEGETLDLEKSWHGLHFLLTGSVGGGPAPLGYLMEGGEEIGEDLGYGPARALSGAQVRDFAAALERISDADLRSRFDPAELDRQGVYPNIWDEGDEALDWLLAYFRELRSFIARAANNGMGVIAYMM